MRELFATLARIAPMDAPVLVYGETGTGKELVARAIHDASPRASKPFVVVDCAALPENLLDAELFGHTRGAFTGAHAARTGAIESAEGGTVFLDEIGELPIAMQPKLLRVLESRTVRRVGEATHRSVDVRFLSATHRDLLTMVNAAEFREDLYFRLSVIPIHVPALRERKDDIELLVSHFLRTAGGASHIPAELMRELMSRPWRGNVRELRNFVERARALGATEALAMTSEREPSARPSSPASVGSVPAAVPGTAAVPGPSAAAPAAADVTDPRIFQQAYKDFRESWVDSGEKEYIRRLLVRHDRNVAAAAREAEVDRTYIYRLIRKHEL
jgi:DNA-binding NtrC family response regulator